MADASPGCSPSVEDVFGPVVQSSCLNGFDFTLLFEEAILTIPPLGILFFWSLQRIAFLSTRTKRAYASWLLPCKLAAYAVHGLLHVALLALWAPRNQAKTRSTIACLCITIVVDLTLAYLSSLEHLRSVRPSTLLITGLGTTLLMDMARVRTLFFTTQSRSIAVIFLVAYLVKVITFALECLRKRRMLRPPWAKTSPEAAASILDRALFIWLNTLLAKGFRSTLTANTLLPLDDEILAASDPVALDEKWAQMKHKGRNSLLWLFARHFKWAFLAGVIPRLANVGFTYAQPPLVQAVLDFTSSREGPNTQNVGYGLIGGFALCYIGIGLTKALYDLKTYRLVALFRGSLVSMIFDKTMRIASSALKESEALTLMSADIDRITNSLQLIHELYANFVGVGVALWLLYDIIGIAMLPGLAWIIICVITGFPIANAAGNAQSPWLEAIEIRLAATARVLGAMKPIKMTGLTDLVSSQLSRLRLDEIEASFRHRLLNIFVFVTSIASFSIAPVLSLITYELLAKSNDPRNTLTQGTAFAALSVFELVHQPVMQAIYGVEDVQTVLTSFRRIQKYLESEDRLDYRQVAPLHEKSQDSKNVFSGDKVTVSYSDLSKPVLENVSFSITRGQVVALYGPVGSGKSTFLRTLLGEMPAMSGTITATISKTAYCPQTAWVCWGTVRENVVASSEWDEKWYDQVVSACDLSIDFQLFSDGDQTRVGSSGSSLSGGQQARLSLARALYSRSPVILLDGVLTGLDRNTEQHILKALFGTNGLLKRMDTTVVFSTIDRNHLTYADQIMVVDGHGGVKAHSGAADIAPFEEVPGDPEKIQLDHQLPLSETKSVPDSEEPIEDMLQDLGLLDDPASQEGRQTGDIKVYGYYASVAGWFMSVLYILTSAILVFSVTFPSIWIQWWTNANATIPNDRLGYWGGVYGSLGVVTLLSCVISESVFRLIICPRTAKRFHELLLHTTMRATTAFLSSTNSGLTLNRFSQDLELIDNDLPDAVSIAIFQLLSTIASSVLIFIGSGYVAAAIPACIAVLAVLAMFYLRTSRQMRLLEIEAKAPLFSLFLETIQGIDCVRAYGWTSNYRERNRLTLNTSQRPYYLLFCLQRWLTLVLDMFNAGLAIVLVAIATSIQGGSTAYLGTALYNVVIFSTTIQELIMQWTRVEMSLGAISRIRTYVRTVEDENLPGETEKPDKEWPTQGHVRFNDITASYGDQSSPVVRNINLEIKAGQKVAICGRTGSGKSSLLSTLLRTINVNSGRVQIDGLDLATLSRQDVREALNTIPQEPYFLPGSVRENLDLFESAEDERLVQILRRIKLWEEFVEPNGGLDEDLDHSTLSHGQKQLFCLGRALLRPGKVVIMDEATSNIDEETAKLMLGILKQEFEENTVIVVAHKLQEVLDFDMIVFLDAGAIVETGNPRELLEDETSSFRQLFDSGET